MKSIFPLIWVFDILLSYFTAGIVLLYLSEGLKYRSFKILLSCILGLIPSYVIYKLVTFETPLKFFLIVFTSSLLLFGLFMLGPGRIDDWKRIKQRKIYIKHILSHLVLVTGGVIFITPFAWLSITSFKEEADIFKYPPSLIPMLQLRVDINGKQHGLNTVSINGKTIQVVDLEDMMDGTKRVAEYSKDGVIGKEHIVNPSELTRLTKPGLKWSNYPEALNYVPPETHKGLLYLWNTVYVTILSIAGTLLSSSLVAYAFARLRWPGRDWLFAVLLATMMIPAAVTMCPVFIIWRNFHCIDTLTPLWLPTFFSSAFSVFLLRQFFMTIPTDLEDAAKIDGCSYFGIYWRIMLPLIKPALATLTILTFMGNWNNFMGPLIYISSPEKMTLAYGLQLFAGAHGVEFGMMMAGATMVMLPVLIIFFFTQRYFIQGITLTGIKG